MRQLTFSLLLLSTLVSAGAQAAPGSAKPVWPTVERQLAADRIAPDTPLAKLIKENQDFRLLRPAEAHDQLPVPLWLRVWWRKAHPQGEHLANDPTGGYPLALKEVHEWMLSHPSLRAPADADNVESILAGSEEKRGGHRKPPPTPTLNGGPDQPISGGADSPRSESDIRVNFWNTDKIVSASNNIESRGTLAVFYSGDGGSSWHQTSLPRQDTSSFHSDPTVEWTSDGTAWATALNISTNPSFVLVGNAYRSADGGATWKLDATFTGDQTQVDKQMTWVDHSDSSPYKDNLYVIWHNGLDVFVNHRTGPDGGWGEPLQISGGETTGTGIGSDIKANRQGTVFAFWPDTGSQKIFFARSSDGGNSFSKPLAIAKTAADFDIRIPAQGRRNVLVYVTSGAFFRSPKKSMVYAAWTDLAGGRGCSSPDDQPGIDRTSPCTTRIWFSRSTNGGNSWSRPGIINNQRDLNDQFNPWLAVDEATGNVAIMYYDTFGEDRPTTNVWAQVSTDDGGSWSAPYKVTSQASNDNDGLPNGNQYGDYNGMSGFAGTFFPSWTDRRHGSNTLEQIWTAPLTVQLKSAARTSSFGESCPFAPLFADQAAAWSPEKLAQPACTR